MSSKKNPFKIGVIDSGSGGLAILKKLKEDIPYAHCDYLCDTLFFPYGKQSTELIEKRLLKLSLSFYQKRQLDLLVIACNTASTLVLDQLRKEIPIPIVGVVPAVKTATLLSKTKKIAIIATERTVNSSYLNDLIQNFASDFQVYKKASPKLVRWSEDKMNGLKLCLEELQEELQDLLSVKNLDSVVLGCTHFSQLVPELEKISPRLIQWIDSTEAISRRVKSLMPDQTEICTKKKLTLEILYTKDNLNQESWKNFIPSITSFRPFPLP